MYDDAERTVTYTDPAGNRQRQVADLLGQVTSVQEYRDGSFQPLESVTYNLAGMVTSRTDGNGQRTAYQYDTLGQVTSVTDPASKACTTMTIWAAAHITARPPAPQRRILMMCAATSRACIQAIRRTSSSNITTTTC
ncbi:RHS repeat domain-containing protein [Paenibacillus enshidis]|uniref:RHS repeat domain-containing protein n=1 Tax=Paenibacillus enshidis TaxID=1458439 RepID=A0ABV5AWE3_9BACL